MFGAQVKSLSCPLTGEGMNRSWWVFLRPRTCRPRQFVPVKTPGPESGEECVFVSYWCVDGVCVCVVCMGSCVCGV